MIKTLDLPPVWLGFFAAAAWSQWQIVPINFFLQLSQLGIAGSILIGCGLMLALLAAVEFRRHRTTIIPHRTPRKILQTGVFAYSRDPIYVADALILTGFILRWDPVLVFLYVPLFIWFIQKRFIEVEERRMAAEFGKKYRNNAKKVRRYV